MKFKENAIKPCPVNQMPDEIEDTMWYFLTKGGQKADIPALEEAAEDLCHIMQQKTAGQKKYKKSTDIDFKNVDWIMWRIVIEATALVLSGRLDELEEPVKHGEWIHDGMRFRGGVDWYHCSACGKAESGVYAKANYCSACGAKMDGLRGRDEDE